MLNDGFDKIHEKTPLHFWGDKINEKTISPLFTIFIILSYKVTTNGE